MNYRSHNIPYLTGKAAFPPPETANPDGLLAMGGDLSPERLLAAYSQGIFPWFNDDTLILWWCPDPRMVLFPERLKISGSMRRVLNSGRFRLSCNKAFDKVVERCAGSNRPGQPGTWITAGMREAYAGLHKMGVAISYETWMGEELVGGIYGVDMGHIFCGESMFHSVSNASKFALTGMVRDLQARGYILIDCQVYNPHLESLGAEEIPRAQFLQILKVNNQTTS